MRVFIIRLLSSLLIVLLPLIGALFGYIIAAFFRVSSTYRFAMVNTGAIVAAPTPMITANSFQ
ncbi:MAG: hypothetical protein ABEK50_14395, partial [bacterium]